MRKKTILISGAGIAGPTLAYWLLHYGFTPTIVERASALRTGGYMIDFWGVGYDVAERMGLLPALRQDGYDLEEVRLVDAAGNRVAGFDARVFQSASKHRFVSLLRGDLAGRLYQLVADKIETVFSDSIASLDEDGSGVTVTFEHAPRRRFDLVVGADGLNSNVRTLRFGDGAGSEKYLGYYAVAFSAPDYSHRDEGAYVSYAVPGRQVARYALRNGASAFLLIFTQDEKLGIDHHDVAAQKSFVRRIFSGVGWECDEILEAMTDAEDLYFDAVAQTRLPQWSLGRVVLLGDAAYCPSLLAGQGSALAMAGAYVLGHALATASGDHVVAFRSYQRLLKPFIDGKQRTATRLGGWFAPRTRVGIWLRQFVTRLIGTPYVGNLMFSRMFEDQLELPSFREPSTASPSRSDRSLHGSGW